MRKVLNYIDFFITLFKHLLLCEPIFNCSAQIVISDESVLLNLKNNIQFKYNLLIFLLHSYILNPDYLILRIG